MFLTTSSSVIALLYSSLPQQAFSAVVTEIKRAPLAVNDTIIDVCDAFLGYEGVVFSIVSEKRDIAAFTNRFDHHNDKNRFSAMAFHPVEEDEDDKTGLLLPKRVMFGEVATTMIPVPGKDQHLPLKLYYKVMSTISRCLSPHSHLKGGRQSPYLPRFVLMTDHRGLISPAYLEELSKVYSTRPTIASHGKKGSKRGSLGLPEGVNFCLDGTSMAYSTDLLQEMDGKWEDCSSSIVLKYPDAELQRCIYQHTKAICTKGHTTLVNVSPRGDPVDLELSSDGSTDFMMVYPTEGSPSITPIDIESEAQRARDAKHYRLAPLVNPRQHQQQEKGKSDQDMCTLNR